MRVKAKAPPGIQSVPLIVDEPIQHFVLGSAPPCPLVVARKLPPAAHNLQLAAGTSLTPVLQSPDVPEHCTVCLHGEQTK